MPAVSNSQHTYLLMPLLAQGSVDIVFVLDALPNVTSLPAFYQKHVVHTQAKLVKSYLSQFERFDVCHEAFLKREQHTGEPYSWLVRSRPDLVFFGPVPQLPPPASGTRPPMVHARMRCLPPSVRNFQLGMLGSGATSLVQCSGDGTCNCRLKGCKEEDVRVEDQLAYVERQSMEAYFGGWAQWYANPRDSATNTACKLLTRKVLDAGASITPMAVRYCIYREAQDKLLEHNNCRENYTCISDRTRLSEWFQCRRSQ